MYFSKNIPGVKPVVMNYKITHIKNRPATRPARCSLAWPDRFFCIFVVAEKRKNMVWTCEAMCKGSHGGRLAQCLSWPEHWSIVVGR